MCGKQTVVKGTTLSEGMNATLHIPVSLLVPLTESKFKLHNSVAVQPVWDQKRLKLHAHIKQSQD